MMIQWQPELASIFTPMRWCLDQYWKELYRDSFPQPEHVGQFADGLLAGNPADFSACFDEDWFVGNFDRDIACYSWIFLGTGSLIACRLDYCNILAGSSFPALAIAHALACLDADADLYAALNRVMEQVANQKPAGASEADERWSNGFVAATTMRTLAAALQGRGKGNHIKLAALFKALRKAHHDPGGRRGTSQEIDDMEQALSRIKSPPRSKRALDTLLDAAYLIG